MHLHPAATCASSQPAHANPSSEANSTPGAPAAENAGDFLAVLLTLASPSPAVAAASDDKTLTTGGLDECCEAEQGGDAIDIADDDNLGENAVALALHFLAQQPREESGVSAWTVNGASTSPNPVDTPNVVSPAEGNGASGEIVAAVARTNPSASQEASADTARLEPPAAAPWTPYSRAANEAPPTDLAPHLAFDLPAAAPALPATPLPTSPPADDAAGERHRTSPAEFIANAARPSEPTSRGPESARPAPPLPDQIRDQFSDNLHQLREQGRVEVRMDLHPPELGRMRLHLAMEHNELHVRLHVDNDAAKQVLDQQLEPLKVRFAEMGVSLGQLDVRKDGGQEHAAPPEGSEQSALPWPGRRPGGRNAYGRSVSPNALVDVIA